MGLKYAFQSAKKRIESLDEGERATLRAICRDIHRAQVALSEKAAPLLQRCMADCQGLCCRRIHPDDIITEWDLLLILAVVPQFEAAMADCIAREPIFAADCIFLENGAGPCLFPDNLRPERCVISFCRVEPSIQAEIGRVMGGFSRLIRFFRFRPVRRLAHMLMPGPWSRRSKTR
ncbi:MAG TPA: hypothetical protein VLT88_04560 [Desulfosarcina sp.]|nr:hypothetical protein [Desulfosarcina sp.]